MADRKETPNILDDLLGGGPPAPTPQDTSMPASQDAGKPARQDTGKPARQDTGKPASHQRSKTSSQDAGKPASQNAGKPAAEEASSGEKVKATFYLSPGALDALEAGWLQLRRLAGKRGQVSKSLIVEISLLAALDELRTKDRGSQLARMMIGK